MKTKIILSVLFFLVIGTKVTYNQVYFTEDFENGGIIPTDWNEEYVTGAEDWFYKDGGHNSFPPSAYEGSYNAIFQVEGEGQESTILYTPEIDLTFAIKPELRFYHTQDEWWSVGNFDELSVHYKIHADSAWRMLDEYTTKVEDWTERRIQLNDSINDISSTYYLGFQATTGWGHGACLDAIQIVETGLVPKHLASVSYAQASTDMIPTGTTDNVILRIEFVVFGNYGRLAIDDLTVNTSSSSNVIFSSGGVKLYLTEEADFSKENQINGGVSVVGDQAVFSGLDYDLPLGYSYLWITYDLETDPIHQLDVGIADASLDANAIHLAFDTTGMVWQDTILYFQNDTVFFYDIVEEEKIAVPIDQYMPSNAQSPTGSRDVFESIFFDDFETDKAWIYPVDGEFERGIPQGLGGSSGNPDPDSLAVSGEYIIGNDLNGSGFYQGDYEPFIEDRGDSIVSPAIPCKYYKNINLGFYRWMNLDGFDYAYIDISNDNGATWHEIWENPTNYTEKSWTYHQQDISSYSSRYDSVRIRFSIGLTNTTKNYSGWNIDDFSLTGDYIGDDLSIVQITKPVNGCNHSGADSVTVWIKNNGGKPSVDVIPLYYSSNGGTTKLYDTLNQSIPLEDSVLFTFDQKINLSTPGIYDFEVSTALPGDEWTYNDKMEAVLYIQKNVTPLHTEDFETSQGTWRPYGNNSTWVCTISNGVMGSAPSGSRYWSINQEENYESEDSSFIESACYNFSDGNYYMLSFAYWMETEVDIDGFNVQYSIDEGQSWKLLDTNDYGWDWGSWYTENVSALGAKGFSGISSGWQTAYQLLPNEIAGEPLVKFRIAFSSDEYVNFRGIAIDDFKIFEAPPDIGVASIDDPSGNPCLNLIPENPSITIQNYGLNDLVENDTIIVGFDVNYGEPIIDTVVLASDLPPSGTYPVTFTKSITIPGPGANNLRAYTYLKQDSGFYFTNNDTLTSVLDVLTLPNMGVPDTIQSKEPDTVVIRATKNINYEYLWKDENLISLSTGDTLKVPSSGWYYLTITDVGGNGCYNNDSVYVELLYNDVGMGNLISPLSNCSLPSSVYPHVEITNYGTDSLLAGVLVEINYQLNEGTLMKDTFELPSNLHAYHSFEVTLDKYAFDLSSVGSYDFVFYTSFGGDTISRNDSLLITVSTFGYPEVNLGNDTTILALSYELDAGGGPLTYLWNTSDTTRYLTVNQTGTYQVEITDTNNCSDTDDIYVRLKIRDISVDTLVAPISSCEITGPSVVQVRVENTGTDTITSADNITMKYKLDAGSLVIESFSPGTDLLPGQTTMHAFTPTVSVSNSGSYSFLLIAQTANDLRTSNDTVTNPVYISPKPVVDFGLGPTASFSQLSYTLDAGAGENLSYLWHDASTNRTFEFTSELPQQCWVIVTDTLTGCFEGDTVILALIIKDINAAATNVSSPICSGPFENVQVTITNSGNTSIGAGSEIDLTFMLDDEIIDTDVMAINQSFSSKTSRNHTVESIDFSTIGNQEFSVIALLDEDLRSWNDTLIASIEVNESPDVDIGNGSDTIQVSLFPYKLDAGSGYSSYSWSNGSTESSINVTLPGLYSVTVTGSNGCSTISSVTLDLGSAIQNLTGSEITINAYPIPFTDIVNITLEQDKEMDFILEIRNLSGILIYQTKFENDSKYVESIDLYHVPSGLYILNIYNNDYQYFGKLLKK